MLNSKPRKLVMLLKNAKEKLTVLLTEDYQIPLTVIRQTVFRVLIHALPQIVCVTYNNIY
jgi:hypothetical protein